MFNFGLNFQINSPYEAGPVPEWLKPLFCYFFCSLRCIYGFISSVFPRESWLFRHIPHPSVLIVVHAMLMKSYPWYKHVRSSQCDAAIYSVLLWGWEGDREQYKCDWLHYSYAIHGSVPSVINTRCMRCTLTDCEDRDVNGVNCVFVLRLQVLMGKRKKVKPVLVQLWAAAYLSHHVDNPSSCLAGLKLLWPVGTMLGSPAAFIRSSLYFRCKRQTQRTIQMKI